MGGAYSTIAADVLARYNRLQGKKVTFITGTDEHGEKIALSATKAGVSPQAHCDRIAARYHCLWQEVCFFDSVLSNSCSSQPSTSGASPALYIEMTILALPLLSLHMCVASPFSRVHNIHDNAFNRCIRTDFAMLVLFLSVRCLHRPSAWGPCLS